MNSLATQARDNSWRLSSSTRWFLIAALSVLTFCIALSIRTAYTTQTYIAATVIAKTKSETTHKGNWEPKFTLALRHPDGTLQDVQTNYATYASTKVGSTWGVMYSDLDRGLPVPTGDRVRMGVMLISLLCAAGAFIMSLACWAYPDD